MQIVPTESLVDIVYGNIKKDILAKKYTGGEKLTVRDFCEQYGVSETPVKQALNRLITENLVESLPRRGMRVCVFDQNAFEETLEARCMVEQYSVDAVINLLKSDKKYAKMLQKALDASIEAIKKYSETRSDQDFDQVLITDLDFHKIMVKATRNHYIMNTYEDLCVRQKMFFVCHANIRKRLPTIEEEHNGIYNALLREDRLEAEYMIKKYVNSVKSYL